MAREGQGLVPHLSKKSFVLTSYAALCHLENVWYPVEIGTGFMLHAKILTIMIIIQCPVFMKLEDYPSKKY